MTVSLHRFICCSALFLVSLIPGANQALAAIAPDVTTLATISSGLSTPVRLAADSAGALYVTDPRGGGIVKFLNNGSYATTVPAAAGILGLAIASNGDILVSQGTSVAVYSSVGVKQREFGTFGKANGIAVTKTGEIFVVDSLNNNIQAFIANYTPRNGTANSFGGSGATVGKFLQPTGIAYEKVADQLAVTDTRNGRVQFFSTSGLYQKSIGSFGAGPLKFTSPQSVSFEYSSDQTTLKRVYIVDAYQSTVQVVDGSTGEFIRYIGGYGVTDGKLISPSDVLFHSNGSSNQLVVANGTGKLSLFGVADPSKGPYLQINTVPQATNLKTLIISGTTTGTSVTVNGVAATLSGTSWSAVVSLSVGVNPITVVATDASSLTTTLTSSVTATAPAADPVMVTVSPVPSVTSQAALTLKGTVTPGAAVTVGIVVATVDAAGAWTATVTLTPGANALRVSASKLNMGTSTADVSITLDTSVPVIATRLPSSGSVFSTPLQTVSGTVSSSYATTIMLTLNGVTRAVPVSDGVFSIPLELTVGRNSVSISVVDSNGVASQPLVSSVMYDPQVPRISITSPAAAESGTATYRLTGTVPAGSSVTINGTLNAAVSGTTWSADVPLSTGINGFEVKATAAAPSTVSTTAMTSVTFSPGFPSLAITSPAKDSPVATANNTFFGAASPNSTVTARVNGTPAPVTISPTGAFSVALPVITTTGTYTVTVNATDPTGATSTSTRSIIYDPTPPTIITLSTSPIKVTAAVLAANDKNGAVGTITYSGGVATLDLTGVSFDPATLNIQAFSPAGLSSRSGSFTGAPKPTISDALRALKISANIDPAPSFTERLSGDVAPMVNFESRPDGIIDLDDVVVILNKVLSIIP